MKKIILFIKKFKVQLLSFFIPILIFLLATVFNNALPFGENLLNSFDGYYQHPGFMQYISEVIKGNESLFYSFKGALGYNFYATAIYYVFNPTNLLSVFFDNIWSFYTFVIFLRIGLSGLTMSIYLKSKGKNDLLTFLFSVCYALIAYNIAFYSNFMWMDSVVIFPLVILGIDKLINKNNKWLFPLTLSFSILSNFYIGYMICIFSLIYFVYSYILLDKEKRNKKIIKNFIILAILSGLACMIVLIPEVFELLNGKSDLYTNKLQTKYFDFSFDFLSVFYNFNLSYFTTENMAYGSPNVYCSILVLVLSVMFFFNKKITKKEKICTGAVLGFFLLSFSFNLLDYSWHLFQRPIWFPNRYSFIFSFFLIIIAYRCIRNLDGIKKINLVLKYSIASIIVCIIIGVSFFQSFGGEIAKIIFFILSIFLIFEYLLLLDSKKFKLVLVIVLLLELSIFSFYTMKKIALTHSLFFAKTEEKVTDEKLDKIRKEEKDLEFYRAEFNSTFYNSGSLYNYNGLKYFNSLRNKDTISFIQKYMNILVVDDCSVRFNASNPLTNALMGLKYFNGQAEEFYYKKFDETYNVFKNEDALSLGYMVNKNVKNAKLNNDFVDDFNNLTTNLTKDNLKLFTKLDNYILDNEKIVEKNNKKYFYKEKDGLGTIKMQGVSQNGGWIIFKTNSKSFNIPKLYINGKLVENISSKLSSVFIEKGSEYIIVFDNGSHSKISTDYFETYYLDYQNYKYLIDDLKQNQLEISKHDKDNYIKGKIKVTKEKTVLFTSIPYDKGWSAYVDGKKVKTLKLINTFLGVELSKGEHIVEFKYIPRGFILGLIISLLSTLICIIYIKKTR